MTKDKKVVQSENQKLEDLKTKRVRLKEYKDNQVSISENDAKEMLKLLILLLIEK